MRIGKTLTELAQELTRINEVKKDYVTPISMLSMGKDGSLDVGSYNFGVTKWADSQMSSYVDIPKAYYDRLRAENTELLARNVNHGLSNIEKERPADKRMIRVLDGNVRAFLSGRYRRLDSYDLLQTVLPLMLNEQIEVVSSDITEKRLYVRALLPRLQADVKLGDPVQYGLQISSSDVGAGSLRVEPLIYRLVCSNGLITSHAMKKYHVGRMQAEGDDVFELMSSETHQLTEAAFWATVKDVVIASLLPEVFQSHVAKLQEAADRPITNFNLQEVVELTCKTVGYTGNGAVKQGILEMLASGNQGAGLTQYGLANAFTAVAARNEEIGFDDIVELERMGGTIINLKPEQWIRIAN